MEVLKNQIASLRKSKGVSQFRLSKLTGISRFRISLFECGYLDPAPEEIERIKAVLKSIATVGQGGPK